MFYVTLEKKFSTAFHEIEFIWKVLNYKLGEGEGGIQVFQDFRDMYCTFTVISLMEESYERYGYIFFVIIYQHKL